MKLKLTSFDLKLIACITMFIDHFAAVFMFDWIEFALNTNVNSFLLDFVRNNQNLMIEIYYLFRTIGRIAFPIYCFLLVQGFIHTKNVGKYCIRLFIFALISEIAFDIGFNYTIFELDYNNVFFTLLLGLCAINALSKIENIYKAYKDKINKTRINISCLLFSIAILIIMYLLADMVFMSDYGFSGVVCIICMYLFKNHIFIGYSLGVIMTILLNNSMLQIYGLFGLLFIMMYSGEKGKSMKYFFYAFYPIHILLITGLSVLLGFRG